MLDRSRWTTPSSAASIRTSTLFKKLKAGRGAVPQGIRCWQPRTARRSAPAALVVGNTRRQNSTGLHRRARCQGRNRLKFEERGLLLGHGDADSCTAPCQPRISEFVNGMAHTNAIESLCPPTDAQSTYVNYGPHERETPGPLRQQSFLVATTIESAPFLVI